jgi:coproporphyrinogen III oxidase-like Fe-S oxidoreductase
MGKRAIGAGAHGKVTILNEKNKNSAEPLSIYRFQKSRLPKDYLAQVPAPALQYEAVAVADLPFEFMMNALRLVEGVPLSNFSARTGQSADVIRGLVVQLQQEKLLAEDSQRLKCTALGFNYLNEVLERFS